MDYKEIRRDLISTFLLYFFLKRNNVILPTSEQAAEYAVEYADALINKLNKKSIFSNRQGKKVNNQRISRTPVHLSGVS